MSSSLELREIIFKLALKNAIEHSGRALPQPVISKLLGLMPELRSNVRELSSLVSEIISEVNKLSLEDQIKLAKERYPEIFERKEIAKSRGLPPLPNVELYKEIRTRFAPNPDFLIHLGNARPAILSYEYAKMYDGKFILRFEDTDPKTKKPLPDAYSLIKDDLRWLGVIWDEEYIQSLRMEVYYELAKELINVGGAYVDLCSRDEYRKYKLDMKPCPHRGLDVDKNLELWDRMLSNHFSEGEAVLRVKTDTTHPDPSVRDWVAFRIIDTDRNPHPITGSKYNVWPTYNYAAGVDDHLMNVTHILRGKEHMVNTIKQRYLYGYFKWRYPEVINVGRLRLEGLILSKSKIKDLLFKYPNVFKEIDDIRFGTIASLRRRGILPEVIRKLIMEVGIKDTDAVISWDNIAATNRKLIDASSKRLMFVPQPGVNVIIKGVPKELNKVSIPLHPTNKDLGSRSIEVNLIDDKLMVLISSDDSLKFRELGYVRLMEYMNIKYVGELRDGILAEFFSIELSDARKLNAPIIQWVPYHNHVRVMVMKPEGLRISRIRGYGEPFMMNLKVNEVVQLVRFGFIKVDKVRHNVIIAIYLHD